MSNTLLRIGTSVIIPARPYRPASPAYTYVKPPDPGFSWQSSGAAYSFVIAEPYFAQNGAGGVSLYPGGTTYTATPLQPAKSAAPSSVVTTAADPGDPGAPARRTDFPPAGWLSFGRSIQAVQIGAKFLFNAGAPAAGVAVGATPFAGAPTAGYGHIRHGLLFSGGEVRSLKTGAFYGSYDRDEVYAVKTGATIEFLRDGAVIGTEPNTLAAGELLYLGAAFYGAGDYLDNPSIQELVTGTSSAGLSPLSAVSAESAYAASMAVLPAFTTESGMLPRSEAVLPALSGASSDRPFGQSLGALPALLAASYGGTLTVLPTNTSTAHFPAQAAASLLLVGETGESGAELPGMLALGADRPYGESTAHLGAIDAATGALVPGTATALSYFLLTVPMVAQSVNHADARDAFAIDIPMNGVSVASVDARDAFEITVAFTAIGDSRADARDSFRFDVVMLALELGGEAWAVNLDGFGSTTYSNYPFESFANIGGRYFGAAMTGIHELDGDDDAGQPIRAAIDFGDVDFGTSLKKTVAEAYLGMSANGHLLLKILAEGREYVYRTRDYSEHMQQQRVTLGKGLRPNYAGLQLFNEDGADFALDSVEFVPVTMSRRI